MWKSEKYVRTNDNPNVLKHKKHSNNDLKLSAKKKHKEDFPCRYYICFLRIFSKQYSFGIEIHSMA